MEGTGGARLPFEPPVVIRSIATAGPLTQMARARATVLGRSVGVTPSHPMGPRREPAREVPLAVEVVTSSDGVPAGSPR